MHTLKETLAYLRVYSPEDHVQMDNCHRRLSELAERQRIRQEDIKRGEKVASNNKLTGIFAQAKGVVDTFFDNKEFMDKLSQSSDKIKNELSLLDELRQLADSLNNASSKIQETMSEVKAALSDHLVKARGLIVGGSSSIGITGHEFKISGLLAAFVMLLTKTPRQIGEILKVPKDWVEPGEVNEREGRCLMNRLKLFSHIFLKKVNGKAPMKALIELNHAIISESDSVFSKMPVGATVENPLPSIFASKKKGPQGDTSGEYEHYVNALRHLQRRVTIQMIYDPAKSFLQKDKKEDKDDLSDGKLIGMTKAVSALPALSSIAASPQKNDAALSQSKVHLLRHCLYRSMKQSYVAVEQSSCMQVLEDFLRNQVKSMDDVKKLKQHDLDGPGLFGMYRDFHPGMDHLPRGSVRLTNFFDLAFENMGQSMSQKMLRKSLGNGARKMLDAFNRELAAICTIGLRGRRSKRQKKSADKVKSPKEAAKKADEKMDGDKKEVEEAPKDLDKKEVDDKKSNSDKDASMGLDDYSDEQARYEIELYEKYGEDADEGESDSPDEEVEGERQAAMESFKDSAAKRIVDSNLPDDQQIIMVKLMSRQHSFLIGYLHNYAEGEVHRKRGGGGGGRGEESGDGGEGEDREFPEMLNEDEVYLLQCRIDDFQQCMEEIEERLLVLKAEKQGKLVKKDEPLPSLQSVLEDPKQDSEMQEEVEEKKASEQEAALAVEQQVSEPSKQDKDMTNEEVSSPEQIDTQAKAEAVGEHGSISLLFNEIAGLKMKKSDGNNPFIAMLRKQQDEQDKKIDRVMRKEKELMRRLTERHGGKKIEEAVLDAVEKDLVKRELEDLIREEGEDVDFEFYFEGRPVSNLSRTLFEMVKESDFQRRTTDQNHRQVEQLRVLQEREDELARKARDLSATMGDKNRDEVTQKISKLKQEVNIIRSLFDTMQRDMGKGRGAPPRFLGGFDGGSIHKLYFCIKERTKPAEKVRLDSLSLLTGSGSKLRQRTKSEAIKELSSESIDKFVAAILDTELRVFDEGEATEIAAKDKDQDMLAEAFIKVSNDQAPEEKKASEEIQANLKEKTAKSVASSQRREMEQRERNTLEYSLKLLKVMSFLNSNQALISEQGMQFIMKGSYQEELKMASPQKNATEDDSFTDFSLEAGFKDIVVNHFYHPKLDLHLQKSLKDPINLVQGISPTLQQIFVNCSFLFPFSTKQLYFRLMSFISSIDVQRSIYYLQQHLNRNRKQDDNLKKITRQKVQIQRDKLIQSAHHVMRKIDKRSFLEFEFYGEEGTGLAPTLEFYDNIAAEFQEWTVPITLDSGERKVAMWRRTTDGYLFPAPICLKADQSVIKEVYEVFRLCGQVVAKAIADDRQIDLPISSLFWKLCSSSGTQLSLFDLKTLDESLYKFVAPLQVCANQVAEVDKLDESEKEKALSKIKIDGADVMDLCITFMYPGYDHIELTDDGENTVVTLERAQDYVDLILHQSFHESVKIQVQAFKRGFNQIFPISALQPFVSVHDSQEELETLICGASCTSVNEQDWTSAEEQAKFVHPDHGYSRSSPQYEYFLRYMSEMPKDWRSQFIKFVTGSKRLPTGGFRALQPNLTIVKSQNANKLAPDLCLPSVMACVNYVKVPAYSSYEIFKGRFDLAVAEGQQSFTLS